MLAAYPAPGLSLFREVNAVKFAQSRRSCGWRRAGRPFSS